MIFFDIDDTLTDSDGAHLRAIRSLVTSHGILSEPTNDQLAPWLQLMEQYLHRYFRGELSLEQQRSGRVMDFFASLGVPLEREEALTVYAEYHRVFLDHCTLFKDVLPALDRLSDRALGIISNGVSSDQLHKLSTNGILGIFSPIVISDSIGIAKPDARLFVHAAQLAHLPAQKCWYIGNSYELDYLGALGAGMKGYWLNRSRTTNGEACRGYGSLTEIVDEILESN